MLRYLSSPGFPAHLIKATSHGHSRYLINITNRPASRLQASLIFNGGVIQETVELAATSGAIRMWPSHTFMILTTCSTRSSLLYRSHMLITFYSLLSTNHYHRTTTGEFIMRFSTALLLSTLPLLASATPVPPPSPPGPPAAPAGDYFHNTPAPNVSTSIHGQPSDPPKGAPSLPKGALQGQIPTGINTTFNGQTCQFLPSVPPERMIRADD